jgi:hypothetical protein
VILASIVSTTGCANVEITNTRVTAITSDQLVIEVVTSKDLREFDKTYYADHVHLAYRPDNTLVSSDFQNPGKPWAFPFSATIGESLACGPQRYCSEWNIPLVDSSNLDLNKYTYELREGVEVHLRLGGGSMGGGRLLSNVVVMKVPRL